MNKLILIFTFIACLLPVGDIVETNATWYGGKLHGRKTASGERFDQNATTCAHRTYKFGTYLKVTNLKNGKSVVVKVNDRGPYAKGKGIDLSLGAAKAIDMVKSGTARVRIEVVNPDSIQFKK